MLTNIAFTVPGEPVGKGRGKINTRGKFARLAPAPKSVNYEGMVAMAAHVAMAGMPLMTGACAIEVDMLLGIPKSTTKRDRAEIAAGGRWPTKKPDVDNVLKSICDGLNGVVWNDDVQVVDVRVIKRYGEVPGVHVRVAAL